MENRFRFVTLVLLLSAVTGLSAQCSFEGLTYGGWYNGHVYYVTVNDMNWLDADAQATALGGYLATIADQDENDFVAGIASTLGFDEGEGDEGQWIGLNDIEDEGSHVWSNGDPVTYTSWGGGEPNNGEYGDGLGNTG